MIFRSCGKLKFGAGCCGCLTSQRWQPHSSDQQLMGCALRWTFRIRWIEEILTAHRVFKVVRGADQRGEVHTGTRGSQTPPKPIWPKTISESGDISLGRRNGSRDEPRPGRIQMSSSLSPPWHPLPQELLICNSNVQHGKCQHFQSTKAFETLGFVSVGKEVWCFTLIWFNLKNLQETKVILLPV